MQWYYSKNGTQLGPVEEGELRGKIASGEISSSDLVWREGMTDWLPSSKVSELASVAPASVTPQPPAFGAAPASPYAPPVQNSPVAYSGNIQSYLWQSIVVTLFCCMPFGIVGIVFAAKVDGLVQGGNIQGAMEASAKAKKWCFAGFISGLVVMVLYIGLMILAGASGSMN